MKVLFVGEGPNDIGSAVSNSPRPARGVIPTLARRVCSAIDADSIALAWTELHRFKPDAKKHGYPGKIAVAALLAENKFGCKATVVVVDRDGKAEREDELREGVERAASISRKKHRTIQGLAIESVEAWTLGTPEAIAEELNVEVEKVRQFYPPGVDIESLSENSGKKDHRPKPLLQRIAELKHRDDSTEFRQAVAERTDIAVLEKTCQAGFGAFARRLRAALRDLP